MEADKQLDLDILADRVPIILQQAFDKLQSQKQELDQRKPAKAAGLRMLQAELERSRLDLASMSGR